jgi:carboxymethylenebutenolidase
VRRSSAPRSRARRRHPALRLVALVLLFASLAPLARAEAQPADSAGGGAAPAPRDATLPASESQAAAVLETSPRHGEYVEIAMPDGGTPIRTWVVWPERKDEAPVVLVIHEIFGLSPWIRALGDQLAREGFIAVVPDLVSGLGPGGGGTDSTRSRDEVVALVRKLTPEMAAARLDAVYDWAVKQPAASSRVATVGFCWGGGVSFAYAAHRPGLRAAVVYYGTSPDSAALTRIQAPVLGLYGGDDARVDATIAPAKRVLDARKRSYQPNLFAGAGHGFLRQQDARDGANRRATGQAWPKTIAFLKRNLEKK